ncbi:MAG: PAS domain-containing protein [Nitrospirota bacterium]
MNDRTPFFNSPIRLLGVVIFSVFTSEFAVMSLLSALPSLPHWNWILLDSALLVLMLSPVVYFLACRPLIVQIQERRMVEDELRQSQKELLEGKEFVKKMTDGLPILIAYVDSEERYRFVNREYENWFRIPAAEVVGKTVREMLGEDNYSAVREKIRKVMSGMIVRFEDKLTLKDDVVRHFEATYIPDFASDLRIRGYFVTAQDITHRKIAEEALDNLSHYHDLILNAAGEGIFGLDLDGKVTFVNHAGAEMLGYSRNELVGQIHHDMVHHTKPDGAPYPREQCIIAAAYLNGVIYSGNNEIFWKKDGTPIWIECMSTPLMEKGRVRGAVVTFSDITDKKTILKEIEEKYCQLENLWTQQIMTKEDLEQSEERAKAQFKGIPVPTYTWQNINHDFILVDYNYAAEEFTKGKVSEWRGAKLSEMYKDMPEVIADMWECFNKKNIIKREMLYRFRSFDAEAYFTVHYSYAPPDLVLVHAEDITERKLAEEKLIDSLREKEVLLREIHHRVKNNMQVVTSLLKLQAASLRDKEARTALKDSQNRVRAMALIHEKLYQAKDLAKIDVAEYIESLVREVYAAYGADPSNVVLNSSVERLVLGVDVAIPCGLIINELLSNALKYAFPSGRSGEIGIQFRRKNDDTVEMVVSDSGIGMPEEIDINSTETLGLHLVTMLTRDQLGGTIDIDRSSGTSFHIEFPIPGGK